MNSTHNPRRQVLTKFAELFGGDHKPTVTGTRLTFEECLRRDMPAYIAEGLYWAELHVGGELIASAFDKDWRAAYRLLGVEVEKIYSGLDCF